MSAGLRLAALATSMLAGCAATGVTLHSQHYRVYVPPEWQVVEAGGDATEIPTLLRLPPPAGGGPTVEVRLYTWLAHGPIADPSGDALRRLDAAGTLRVQTAVADGSCSHLASELAVFGTPARAIHGDTGAGQRVALAGGYASGSLVAIIAIVPATASACADAGHLDAAVERVAAVTAAGADTTRPAPRPPILDDPNGGRSIVLPPADPSAPSP